MRQLTLVRQIFSRIISGGQTGSDQGALDAALELNHPCGGWCPKGRKSESGPIPDKYPVQENNSPDYKVRTRANVKDSDGTLIFSYGEPEGGTKLTVDLAFQYEKPLYVFDLDSEPLNRDPEFIWKWGWESEIFVLNVAGPRESKNPGTQFLVKKVVYDILEYARKCYPIRSDKA